MRVHSPQEHDPCSHSLMDSHRTHGHTDPRAPCPPGRGLHGLRLPALWPLTAVQKHPYRSNNTSVHSIQSVPQTGFCEKAVGWILYHGVGVFSMDKNAQYTCSEHLASCWKFRWKVKKASSHWESKPGSSQRCPGFDSWRVPASFTFLYFHLITSILTVHKAYTNNNITTSICDMVVWKCTWLYLCMQCL